MTDKGWCPFARQHRTSGGEGPFGYPADTRGQNKPMILVDHIMDGYKSTLDSDAWRHQNGVSVHAGVGRDGSLDQYVNIFDAAYGNGTTGRVSTYDRTNPILASFEQMGQWKYFASEGEYGLINGFTNVINTHSISTEHEGFPQDVWTPEMVATSMRWHKWCMDELAGAGVGIQYTPDVLIGHFQIDGVNRVNCPGPNWTKQLILKAIGGRMYTDEQIDAKIQKVNDAIGQSLALGVRNQTSVSDFSKLLKEIMKAAELPEDQENARLQQIDAYLAAASNNA